MLPDMVVSEPPGQAMSLARPVEQHLIVLLSSLMSVQHEPDIAVEICQVRYQGFQAQVAPPSLIGPPGSRVAASSVINDGVLGTPRDKPHDFRPRSFALLAHVPPSRKAPTQIKYGSPSRCDVTILDNGSGKQVSPFGALVNRDRPAH